MSQGLIHYLVLLPAFYLGVITSVQDTRHGKIYRRHVSLGLWVGFAWLILISAFHALFLNEPDFVFHTVPRILLATGVSFVVALSMWWFDVWSAADAKLFTVFTLLMPLSVYVDGRQDFFVPVVLLVNAYTVAFLFISVDFLVRLERLITRSLGSYRGASEKEKSERLEAVKAYLAQKWPDWMKTLLGFTFLMLLMRLIRNAAREQLSHVVHWDNTLVFLVFFLAFRPLHSLFQKRLVAVAVVLSLAVYAAYLFHSDPTGDSLSELFRLGAWSIALMAFREVYSAWARLVEVKRIPLDELKEHQILSHSVRDKLLAQEVMSAEELKQLGVEGLTLEYAKRIKELYHDEEADGSIEVENTIPFAPFLFAGLVVTFWVGGVWIRLN